MASESYNLLIKQSRKSLKFCMPCLLINMKVDKECVDFNTVAAQESSRGRGLCLTQLLGAVWTNIGEKRKCALERRRGCIGGPLGPQNSCGIRTAA